MTEENNTTSNEAEAKDMFGWLFSAGLKTGGLFSNPVSTALGQLNEHFENTDVEAVAELRQLFTRLAQEHDEPWLDIFGRHWDLQARLILSGEGAAAIPDAVAAFELAHREENLECPQAVCTTQDLCIAYSNTDGQAYAQQVIEACDETLARIDKTWTCFGCIMAEKGRGLSFLKRHEEALAVFTEAGGPDIAGNKEFQSYNAQMNQLIELGRVEEADELLKRADEASDGTTEEFLVWRRNLLRARLDALMGRRAEALAGYAAAQDPLDESSIVSWWFELVDTLLKTNMLETSDQLHATKLELATRAHKNQSFRDAFEHACSAALWAGRAGDLDNAKAALAVALEFQADLVAPGDAEEKLAEIDAALSILSSGV